MSVKRAPGRVAATEAWYGSIIRSAPDGILVADAAGLIILANDKVEAMFGYGAGELIGRPIEVLVPPAVRERHVGLRDGFLQIARAHPFSGRGQSPHRAAEAFGEPKSQPNRRQNQNKRKAQVQQAKVEQNQNPLGSSLSGNT